LVATTCIVAVRAIADEVGAAVMKYVVGDGWGDMVGGGGCVAPI
jgi:hypothetical protein